MLLIYLDGGTDISIIPVITRDRMMQINLLWQGHLYNSLENCLFSTIDTGIEVNSTITGMFDKDILKVEYLIRTNQNWETVFFEVRSHFADKRDCISFYSDGNGNWTTNGKSVEKFDGCIDVDISLTPFTNTLPINRLKLSENENRVVKVLYIDVLERQIKPVKQIYKRLSNTEYKYENVPNDFETVIMVDELGFVLNYPALFVRTAMWRK